MSEPLSPRERAFAAWNEGRYPDVVAAASAWLGRQPGSGEAYQIAGQALVRQGDASASDHVEASIIDTRAREVQAVLKEQAAER